MLIDFLLLRSCVGNHSCVNVRVQQRCMPRNLQSFSFLPFFYMFLYFTLLFPCFHDVHWDKVSSLESYSPAEGPPYENRALVKNVGHWGIIFWRVFETLTTLLLLLLSSHEVSSFNLPHGPCHEVLPHCELKLRMLSNWSLWRPPPKENLFSLKCLCVCVYYILICVGISM